MADSSREVSDSGTIDATSDGEVSSPTDVSDASDASDASENLECGDSGRDPAANFADWVAPANRWPSQPPPNCTVGEGFEVGDVVPDLRLRDQFGDEVSLWQFTGNVVLLDVGTLWCRPCQVQAQSTEEIWQEFQPLGFVYLTVLQEDGSGDAVDRTDLEVWANDVPQPPAADPITAPVLADFHGAAGTAAVIRNGQYPAVLLIGRDLVVLERIEQPSELTIREALGRWLPN